MSRAWVLYVVVLLEIFVMSCLCSGDEDEIVGKLPFKELVLFFKKYTVINSDAIVYEVEPEIAERKRARLHALNRLLKKPVFNFAYLFKQNP